MKKEDKGFSFKKTIFWIILIMVIIAISLYSKKDYCEPEEYTITDASSKEVTKSLEEWFNSFGGELHCMDSRENLHLVSGKVNNIVCGIKPQDTGEYTVEITKVNARISKPAEIEKWITEKTWSGNAIGAGITKASLLIAVPEGMEGEALNIDILLRRGPQIIATETLYFNVIEKDTVKEGVC